MPATVIVGLQWGDEGKGKVSYLLSRGADCVVRFQGGANAGHTVVVDSRRLKFNMLPAGSATGATPCIAAGVVVDLERLLEELKTLEELGYGGRLVLSHAANLVLEMHKQMDGWIEERRGGRAVGTTRRGVGPAYADRALRLGLRVEDLLDERVLKERIETLKSVRGIGVNGLEKFRRLGEMIRPYVADVSLYLNKLLDEGGRVVFEGAQGALLDVDYGTYPYVTSSNTTAGAACASCGIGPRKVDEVVGVAKAYTTRVGAGVFPTELRGALAERVREVGGEYGTTTGRPRRVGWLDIPLLRYTSTLSAVDWIAVTKLDVLSGIERLKICVRYEFEGVEKETLTPSVRNLRSVHPTYIEAPGWPMLRVEEWRRIAEKGWEALPENARHYIEIVEELVGKPVKLVSIGESVGMEIWR